MPARRDAPGPEAWGELARALRELGRVIVDELRPVLEPAVRRLNDWARRLGF